MAAINEANTIERDHASNVIDEITERCAEMPGGEVATYNPRLAEADPSHFALALSHLGGDEQTMGDVDVAFPIQSISKVFSLTLAMQHHGSDDLWSRVGREPSGDPFNSLVQLEYEQGIPRNPLINAGAIVIDDILIDVCDDVHATGLELLSELAGAEVTVDEAVYRAETDSDQRNRGMAYLMASFGNLKNPVDHVIDIYNKQCSVSMTARQLARATRFLANDGVDPASGRRVLSASDAHRVNAIMFTCGTYDASGEFAFSVGMPCKSGVGGGIIAVSPHRMGICVYSPALDETGNSLAGRTALSELAKELDLSVF